MSGRKLAGLLSIFLVLLTLVSSFALQEQFTVSSGSTIAACSHSVATQTIVVTNTGDIESSYRLAASGSASDFVTYSDGAFSLKSGESKSISIFFSPGDRQGTFSLTTTIATALGLQKSATYSIAINNCANIQLNVRTPAITSNPCQVSQFSFDITNPGDYPETYKFGAKGLEQYTTLSTDFLVLGPRETKQIDLFVNPSCDLYGQKELTFQALATTSNYLAEAPVILNIVQAYDYDVTLPSQISICNLKQTTIPITLQNKVPFVNEFGITLRGPSWLSAEKSVLVLPYEALATNLIAQPEHAGTYSFDIITTSARGDVTKAGSQNITVEDCYDTELNIEQPSDIIVAGHSQTYTTTITNHGTKPDTFTFGMASPDWVSGNMQKVILQPGESKALSITAKTSANTTGTFKTILQATSQETNAVKQDQIVLRVVQPEDAYNLAISAQHTRILYGQDVVALSFKNKGLLPATYDITVQGPAFAKLETSTITLQPGETQAIALDTDTQKKDAVADYEIIATATVKGENVGFTNTFNVKLRPTTLTQDIEGFVLQYWIFLVAGAVVLIIVVTLVVFRKRISQSFRNRKIRRQEQARIRAQVREERRARKLAKKLLKESMKKPRNWKQTMLGFVLIIASLVLLAGAGLAIAGYGPFAQEFFRQEQQVFEPIIKVDTTNLEAYGNTVIIRGENTDVPVAVMNNFNEDLVFDVQSDASWIKTDTKRITLKPGEQDVVTLTVTPDMTVHGVYKVGISANLEKENKLFKEDVTLNITQRDWKQEALYYVPYLVGGIIILIIGLIVRRKAKKQKAQAVEKRMEIKPARKIELSMPKKK